MAPPSWATTRQDEFLTLRQEDFAKAQDPTMPEFTLADFRANVHRDFFAQWPTQEDEDRDRATMPSKAGILPPAPSLFATNDEWVENRKKKIAHWFNNHPLGKKRARGGGGKAKVNVSVNPVGTRMRSKKEVYGALHWERLKETVDSSILTADKKVRLAGINREIARAYENETDEVKANVDRAWMEEKAKKAAERDLLFLKTRVGHVERTPEEYADAQFVLPGIMQEFLAQMEIFSGFSFSVLAGGPDPKLHGDIATMGFHSTVNKEGKSFSKAHPSFNETFLLPFSTYLHQVYPIEIRNKRALIPHAGSSSLIDGSPSRIADSPSPTTGSPSSIDGSPLPTAGSPLPINGSPSPTTGSPSPIAAPIAGSPSPTTGSPSPIAGAPSPTTPIAGSPSPIAGSPSPTTGSPSPTTGSPSLPDVQPLDGEHNTPPIKNLFPVRSLTDEEVSEFSALLETTNFSPADIDTQRQALSANSAADWWNNAVADTRNAYVEGNTSALSGDWQYTHDIHASQTLGTPRESEGLYLPNVAMGDATNRSPAPRNDLPQLPMPSIRDDQPHNLENDSSLTQTQSGRSRRQRKVVTKEGPVALTDPKAVVHGWLDSAQAYLSNSEVQLASWNECLADWVKFENENGAVNTTSSRLPGSTDRPPELTKWLGTRKYTNPPKIDDPIDFASRWLLWWNSIQPQWRRTSEVNQLPLALSISTGPKQNLTSLRKTGPSGVVVLLISLKWWSSIHGSDERWEMAVKDIHNCIKSFLRGDKKRKASEEDENDSVANKARKVD